MKQRLGFRVRIDDKEPAAVVKLNVPSISVEFCDGEGHEQIIALSIENGVFRINVCHADVEVVGTAPHRGLMREHEVTPKRATPYQERCSTINDKIEVFAKTAVRTPKGRVKKKALEAFAEAHNIPALQIRRYWYRTNKRAM